MDFQVAITFHLYKALRCLSVNAHEHHISYFQHVFSVFCLPRLPCPSKEHQTSQDASMCSEQFRPRTAFLLVCMPCRPQSHQATIRMHPSAYQPNTSRLKPDLPSPDTARSVVSCAKRSLMREAHPSEARNPILARAANGS